MVVNESLRESGVYHPGDGTLSRFATGGRGAIFTLAHSVLIDHCTSRNPLNQIILPHWSYFFDS